MTLPLSSVLVLGAGELGLSVLQGLLSQPSIAQKQTTLSVLLRPESTSSSKDASQIQSWGITIIRHDISSLNPDSLARILKPYDAVISCLGFAAGPGTQLKITQAALAAGVKRFFPWQFGVDYDAIGRGSGQTLFDEQLQVRKLLREQSEVDWVIVSTGVFMSFVFEESFGLVLGVKDLQADAVYVRGLGSWENGLTVTAVEDIGRLTAMALFDGSVRQQVVHTAGESFTYEELAAVVGRVSGKTVHKELWDRRHLMEDLNVEPDDTIRKYRVAFASGKGVKWDKATSYNETKGIAVASLSSWLASTLGQ
ncbi:hypothetical protein KVT40_005740 [Elsinoe batatas]|uniref:NmrA-like domain-containing protein n=1 Tax=Elsinoe batatas TaxID=2601811 RepID=A0A8K0L0T4_9PEZI|nr:hypothetical protein KVT40_005740 [Elsinoe batatas]